MDVVLVNPPILIKESVQIPTRAHNPFEHMGLGYVGAVLRRAGYRVKIIDSYITPRTIRETADLIEAESPRVVGFSATHEFLTPALKIAQLLRQRGFEGHVTMGGYLPTFLHDTLLSKYPQIDSIVRGEGEMTILELMEHLDNPDKWDRIAGLSHKRGGQLHVNPARDLIDDLSTLPNPCGTPCRILPGCTIIPPFPAPGDAPGDVRFAQSDLFTSSPGGHRGVPGLHRTWQTRWKTWW